MENREINLNVVECKKRELIIEEWIFIGEYLQDGNASRSVRVSGYVGDFAGEAGYAMLKRPHVERELIAANDRLRERAGLDQTDVVQDIVNVLKADPRDLVQLLTGSCRHCHGFNHDYQRTAGEMKRDYRNWCNDEDAQKRGVPFDVKGGEGFNAYRDPHVACPECYGKGVQIPRLKDTRTLSPETASLFAGIKQTKYGLELVLRSKDAAREAAAKYLGMNKETLDLTVTRKLESYTDAELIQLMNKK